MIRAVLGKDYSDYWVENRSEGLKTEHREVNSKIVVAITARFHQDRFKQY